MLKNTKLVKSDYEIYEIIEKEKQRQYDHLELLQVKTMFHQQ